MYWKRHVEVSPSWAISNCGLQTSTGWCQCATETLKTSMCRMYFHPIFPPLCEGLVFGISTKLKKKTHFLFQLFPQCQCRDTFIPALRMHWKSQNVKTWRTKIVSCLLFLNLSVFPILHIHPRWFFVQICHACLFRDENIQVLRVILDTNVVCNRSEHWNQCARLPIALCCNGRWHKNLQSGAIGGCLEVETNQQISTHHRSRPRRKFLSSQRLIEVMCGWPKFWPQNHRTSFSWIRFCQHAVEKMCLSPRYEHLEHCQHLGLFKRALINVVYDDSRHILSKIHRPKTQSASRYSNMPLTGCPNSQWPG